MTDFSKIGIYPEPQPTPEARQEALEILSTENNDKELPSELELPKQPVKDSKGHPEASVAFAGASVVETQLDNDKEWSNQMDNQLTENVYSTKHRLGG